MAGHGPPLMVKLLSEQRKRCLATILTAAEQSPWWPALERTQQDAFRDQVRAAVAVFYDLVRDVIKVSDDDTVRNDHALELIRAIHSQQQDLVHVLTVHPPSSSH